MWDIYFSFAIPYLLVSIANWIIDMKTTLVKYRYYNWDENLLKTSYANVHFIVALNLYFFYPSLLYLTINPNNFRYHDFNIIECCWNILLFSVIYEISSYITHRILHQRFFYDLIHYKHHELNITIALGGFYCHPLELIINNFFPATIGIHLLENSYIYTVNSYLAGILGIQLEKNHHIYTIYFWSTLAALGNTLSHSGYFGIHIVHHWHQKRYYGAFGIMDYLFRTNRGNVIVKNSTH